MDKWISMLWRETPKLGDSDVQIFGKDICIEKMIQSLRSHRPHLDKRSMHVVFVSIIRRIRFHVSLLFEGFLPGCVPWQVSHQRLPRRGPWRQIRRRREADLRGPQG